MRKQKPAKSQSFLLKPDLYPVWILVSIGQEKVQLGKDVRKHLNIIGVPEDTLNYFNYNGHATNYGDGKMILWLREAPTTPATMSVLAHEIMHITVFTMARLGIKLCDESDEAFCYFHGWLTEQVLRHTMK
jgi:hypothetical protein